MIVVVSILVVKLAIHVYKFISYVHVETWKYCAEYEQYEDDFNLVKDYIATEFPHELDKWLSVSNNGGKGITLYNPDIREYLVLPDDVASSLDTICRNGFPNKDSNLDVIKIHEGRISFCISNGEYALVYSPEEKPTWVNSPFENTGVKVKKIQDGWYHVVKD